MISAYFRPAPQTGLEIYSGIIGDLIVIDPAKAIITTAALLSGDTLEAIRTASKITRSRAGTASDNAARVALRAQVEAVRAALLSSFASLEDWQRTILKSIGAFEGVKQHLDALDLPGAKAVAQHMPLSAEMEPIRTALLAHFPA